MKRENIYIEAQKILELEEKFENSGEKCMPPKKKIPEGKRELSVLISEKTYRMVAELAPKIYGKYRGALSEAVEEALQDWIAAHTAAHIKTNPPPTIRERYNKVVAEIRKQYGFIPLKVPKKVMEQAIMKAFNVVDPRTIVKWLHTFYYMGFIKPLGVKVRCYANWKHVLAVEIVAKET